MQCGRGSGRNYIPQPVGEYNLSWDEVETTIARCNAENTAHFTSGFDHDAMPA
jgi:hypothetical protein